MWWGGATKNRYTVKKYYSQLDATDPYPSSTGLKNLMRDLDGNPVVHVSIKGTKEAISRSHEISHKAIVYLSLYAHAIYEEIKKQCQNGYKVPTNR